VLDKRRGVISADNARLGEFVLTVTGLSNDCDRLFVTVGCCCCCCCCLSLTAAFLLSFLETARLSCFCSDF
jgi:hypothetical protein